MRLVLDTNVIISALLFDGLPEQLLLSTLGGLHGLVLSSYIIAETTRILEDRFKAQPTNIKLLQQLLSEADVVYFQPFLHVITDEPDNRILETSVKGNADYLVTGDKLLLELKEHKNIKIISVRDCVTTLALN
ncbi:MAG TPA: putative toxin-antitoxin system toxin component, PIN family [Candidatus Saccharimonadales bacterium]|nr:putative toxin-antitoxin system toxin component, PIN family [Candidatus Saccharimonadales bacterium]